MEANQFASVNHTWTLSIDGFALKRAKQQLGLNLFKSIEDFEGFMENFAENPDVYLDLLWILCDKQATERGLDEVAFASEFRGSTLISSTDAFMTALADFFQNDQLTEAVSLIVKFRSRLRADSTEGLKETVDQLSREIESYDQQTTTTSSSSNSQESSESSPKVVPSES